MLPLSTRTTSQYTGWLNCRPVTGWGKVDEAMGQASFRHRIIERDRRRQRRTRAAMYDEAVRLARLAAARFRFRRLYLFGSVTGTSGLAV